MITIDFSQKTPIYKQLVEQLTRMIKSGELKPGDRLPTERDLAEKLCIARGTVKKAYKELSDNNIIEVIHGSGSYVYNERETIDLDARRKAAELMEQTYDRMAAMGLSHKEIGTLLHIALAKKAPPESYARIAVIDCNPESLSVFKRQLSYIPGIVVSSFFVDTIIMDDDADELMNDYDLVLTTVTHYDTVAKSLTRNRENGCEPLRPAARLHHRHTVPKQQICQPYCRAGGDIHLPPQGPARVLRYRSKGHAPLHAPLPRRYSRAGQPAFRRQPNGQPA